MGQKTALDSKCPGCGSPLKWEPTTESWKCEFCDSTYTLEELKSKSNKAASEDNNVKSETVVEDKSKTVLKEINPDEMDQYKCGNCGAIIMSDLETVATKCPYCNNTTILKERLDNGIYPTKIIPFTKTRKDAEDGFYALAKGKLFAPAKFHKAAHIKDVTGIYVPFWLYDVSAKGDVIFRGEDVRHWVSGNVSHTETKTFKTTVNSDILFAKLPVDGSTRFDDGLMDAIEPFDYEKLVDYNHAYLSGFLAEKYDVSKDDAFERAYVRCNNSVEDEAGKKVFHTAKHVVRNQTHYKVINSEFAFFPVWMVNIEYDGKFYTFAMNGQTGETVGNIPVSVGRAFFFTLLFFIVMFVFVFLFIFIMTGGY